VEVAAAAAPTIQAEREQRMPLGFIVFGGLSLVVRVLWLDWLVAIELVLTNARSRDSFQAKYESRMKPGAHAASQPISRNVVAQAPIPHTLSALWSNSREIGLVFHRNCRERAMRWTSPGNRHRRNTQSCTLAAFFPLTVTGKSP
jgi:hypothetical protein